jgi:hypothetical protein
MTAQSKPTQTKNINSLLASVIWKELLFLGLFDCRVNIVKVYGCLLNGLFISRLLKIYKKINRFIQALSYFVTRDWNFTNKNVQALWEKLDEDDRKLFDFDLEGLDWDKYFYNYVRGVRMYLLKDELATVPRAVVKYKRCITLSPKIHELINSIWNTEKLPDQWKESIIIILFHKKGDKTDCSNYRGISLLSTSYNIL